MFVCKYNDPLYVKLEKIAVMACPSFAEVDRSWGGFLSSSATAEVQLASERNVDQVLSESGAPRERVSAPFAAPA